MVIEYRNAQSNISLDYWRKAYGCDFGHAGN